MDRGVNLVSLNIDDFDVKVSDICIVPRIQRHV